MEQIKENMFFVVTGVIVLLCVAFFFIPVFSVRSWESQNAAQESQAKELQGKLDEWLVRKIVLQNGRTVEGWVVSRKDADPVEVKTRSGDVQQVLRKDIKEMTPTFIPNESAIDAATAYKTAYETMFEGKTEDDGAGGKRVAEEGVKTLFARMQLETVIPGLSSAEQENAPKFLEKYHSSIEALKKEMPDNNIKTDAGTWYFWDWGSGLPFQKEQRDEATREYFLASDVLGVIQQKSLNVYSLDRLEIDVDPVTDKGTDKSDKWVAPVRQRRGDYFDVVPFVVELKMRFQDFPQLVGKLLTMKTPVNIDSAVIGRLTDDQRKVLKERDKEFAKGVLLVNVKLTCFALNYREVAATPTGGENRLNTPGPMGGMGGGISPMRRY